MFQLDYNQEKASKCLNNHSIIIAGAGCGKTSTLIKKVENLINNSVSEKEILVLSFTNENVNNFIKKCKYNIKVLTFHKAALQYIKEDFNIAEEYILEDVIQSVLKSISVTLKKKLFHMYYRFNIYNDKNYKSFINNKKSNSISVIIRNICKLVKTNEIDLDKLSTKIFSKNEIIILYLVKSIINSYNYLLENEGLIDFDDIIIKATKSLNNKESISEYKHILVDEYQDISLIRFKFLKALINSNNAILTVVGDDWQSIYRFSGSNIKLFNEFENQFPDVKKYFITNSYRCPEKIIKISTKFILKNKLQIKKELRSMNNVKGKYKKIYTSSYKSVLYKILKNIEQDKSVLILSRNSYDISNYLSNKLQYKNDRFIIDGVEVNNVRFMTIHSSKGLEADVVIILNLKSGFNGFPSDKTSSLCEKILGYHEPIKFAEERRLFYVALTRSKSDLYLIIDKKNSSIFANKT